jgi:hypothetical protein
LPCTKYAHIFDPELLSASFDGVALGVVAALFGGGGSSSSLSVSARATAFFAAEPSAFPPEPPLPPAL